MEHVFDPWKQAFLGLLIILRFMTILELYMAWGRYHSIKKLKWNGLIESSFYWNYEGLTIEMEKDESNYIDKRHWTSLELNCGGISPHMHFKCKSTPSTTFKMMEIQDPSVWNVWRVGLEWTIPWSRVTELEQQVSSLKKPNGRNIISLLPSTTYRMFLKYC